MRLAEEESLEKCRAVVQKMKQAMAKQKNVSLDVKNGAAQLEELFDIIKSYRRNWMMSEKKPQPIVETNNQPMTMPQATTSKRRATSPAEIRTATRLRKEEAEQWKTLMPKKPRKLDVNITKPTK